jgi:hypothetical protein
MTTSNDRWNIYATPALISLALLLTETVFLALKLPETKSEKPDNGKGDEGQSLSKVEVDYRLRKLRRVGNLHGLFLLFFSGVSAHDAGM